MRTLRPRVRRLPVGSGGALRSRSRRGPPRRCRHPVPAPDLHGCDTGILRVAERAGHRGHRDYGVGNHHSQDRSAPGVCRVRAQGGPWCAGGGRGQLQPVLSQGVRGGVGCDGADLHRFRGLRPHRHRGRGDQGSQQEHPQGHLHLGGDLRLHLPVDPFRVHRGREGTGDDLLGVPR